MSSENIVCVAEEVAPTIVSPTTNAPLTLPSSRTLVDVFQVLTLAVVPLVEPVTTSL